MLEKETLIRLLRTMYRIRFFEERLKKHYDYRAYFERPASGARDTGDLIGADGYDFASHGLIGGAVHLSIGQEAVSAGIGAHLGPRDAAFSSHRSHGHALAKGADVKAAFAELMGRKTGLSRGYGGSMHLFDPANGFLGGNGIIGGQIPLALGPAFAAKYRGEPHVSVVFFGDGGANQGTLLESLNLAALWKLPVLFVCENNLWANQTPVALSLPTEDVAPRAEAFGIPGEIIDGQDVLAVYHLAGEAVSRARSGGGPTFIEAKTFRFEGHCGVSRGHEDPEQCAEWRKRDPILLFEQRLACEGTVTPEEQRAIRTAVLAEIDEAEAFATSSPFPDPEELSAFL